MCSKKFIVYQHKNKMNNKSYIGITSQDPEKRWNNGEGYKLQPFYEAIKKYGWDNFEHIILEKNLTKKQAEEKEQFYIKYFDSYRKGYNFSEGGESGFNGGHHKEKTKQIISQKLSQYIKDKDQDRGIKLQEMLKNNPEINQKRIENINNIFKKGSQAAKDRVKNNNKKVRCIELNKIFNSIKEAADFAKVDNSGITHCLKGQQKTSGGYHWEYV